MPGLDGYQATRRIRKAEAAGKTRVPIVAMTAHAISGAREECLDAGMDDFISKPVAPQVLVDTIENWVSAPSHARKAIPEEKREPAGDPVVFDREGLFTRVLDDEELFYELLKVFKVELPIMIAAIEDALASAEAETIRMSAHTLKGAASNIGAPVLLSLAREIEALAARGLTQGSESLVPVLERLKKQAELFLGEVAGAKQA